MSPVTVYLFAGTEFTWMWTDKTKIPAWKFSTPNPRKASRRQRIFPNAVDAYHSMLAGCHGIEEIRLSVYGVDSVRFPDHQVVRELHDPMFVRKEGMKNHVMVVYTPFFSSPSMDWYSDPSVIAEHHLYVDASASIKEDKKTACFAIFHKGSGMRVEDISDIAESSVDAEYKALIQAVKVASGMAEKSGERMTVFADCNPAIVRVLFTHPDPELNDVLGKKVFLQWLPGHKGYPGMNMVDQASRSRVRSLNGC